MYTKITNPEIIIYDGDTNELIGTARFDLSPKSEYDLLQLVNYNITPSSLLMLNMNLYDPAEKYVRPEPYYKYMRYGKIIAFFTDTDTKSQISIEIILKYNARANSANTRNPHFYDSVNFDNIEIMSVNEVWIKK